MSMPAKDSHRKIRWHRWYFASVFTVLVLLIIIIYCWALWRKPNITTDYLAKINARALQTAEEDRAWPLYQAVLIDFNVINMEHLPGYGLARNPEYDPAGGSAEPEFLTYDNMIKPSDPRWPEAQKKMLEHAPLFEAIRQASLKKELGIILRENYTGQELQIMQALSMYDRDYQTNALVWLPADPMVVAGRTLEQIMLADFLHAMHNQDYDRSIEALRTNMRIARHLHQIERPLNRWASQGYVYRLLRAAGQLIDKHAHSLTTDQLQAVETLLEQAMQISQESLIPWDGTQWLFEDTVQRIYDKNGVATYEGVLLLITMSNHPLRKEMPYKPAEESYKLMLSMPLLAWTTANQKQLRDEYERLAILARSREQLPLKQFNPGKSPLHYALNTIQRDESLTQKYWPLIAATYANSWEYFLRGRKLQIMKHDALKVAIALERYRREHDRYPETLGQIVPTYLPEHPQDHATGDPLLYKLLDGKPLLYSRGFDGDDDDAATAIIHGRDEDGDWILYPNPEID